MNISTKEEFKMQKELSNLKHQNKMKELEFMRGTDKLKHSDAMRALEFKSEQIKKSILMKHGKSY